MIEEVEKRVYRASDGSMWDDRGQALRRERELAFEKRMKHHFYNTMDTYEILDTMTANWDIFRNFFNREDLNG